MGLAGFVNSLRMQMKSEYKGDSCGPKGSAFGKGEAEDADAYVLCFQQFQATGGGGCSRGDHIIDE